MITTLSRVVRLDWEDTADYWARLCVEGNVSRYLYDRPTKIPPRREPRNDIG